MHMYKKAYLIEAFQGKKTTVNHPHHVQYGMSTSPPQFRVSWKPLVEIRTVSTRSASYVKMVSEFFFLH